MVTTAMPGCRGGRLKAAIAIHVVKVIVGNPAPLLPLPGNGALMKRN
jgi:hypothetical protein